MSNTNEMPKPDISALNAAADAARPNKGADIEEAPIMVGIEQILRAGKSYTEEMDIEGDKVKIRAISAMEANGAFLEALVPISNDTAFKEIWPDVMAGNKIEADTEAKELILSIIGNNETVTIAYKAMKDFYPELTKEMLKRSPHVFKISDRVKEISGLTKKSKKKAEDFGEAPGQER